MKVTKNMKLNCLQILLFIIGLYIAASICKSRENWWFSAPEEDDSADMAFIGAMMQEAREEEAAAAEAEAAAAAEAAEEAAEAAEAAAAAEAEAAAAAPVDCKRLGFGLCTTNPACKLGHITKKMGLFDVKVLACVNK